MMFFLLLLVWYGMVKHVKIRFHNQGRQSCWMMHHKLPTSELPTSRQFMGRQFMVSPTRGEEGNNQIFQEQWEVESSQHDLKVSSNWISTPQIAWVVDHSLFYFVPQDSHSQAGSTNFKPSLVPVRGVRWIIDVVAVGCGLLAYWFAK